MQNKNHPLRILFLTDNFPPEVNAPAYRTYEHCKEWIKDGVEVTVITSFPNFPVGKVFGGYKNKLYQNEVVDGIRVVRVWTYMTANKGIFKRTLDYFSFAVSSFIAGLFVKSDIIVATSPQFFTALSGYLLAKIKNKRWIFELRDLWPESILAVGALTNNKLIALLEKIELALYKDSAKVIVVTEAFKENLANRGIDPRKIHVIPNGIDLELFSPRNKDTKLLDSLGLKDKFIIGYIGTHGMAHGLDFILRSISQLKMRDLHFLFIGDGACKTSLVGLARRLRLKNVTFLDAIPKMDVPYYLSIVDVSLIHLRKRPVFKTVIPSKIFESIAMEKPVLLGVDGEARKLVEKYKVGLFFEPENSNDFLQKLIAIKNDKNLYIELKRNCRRASYDFDRRILARKMLEIIRGACYI